MRLYHPGLGREITCPSQRCAAVLAESGWKPAPDPEPAEAGKEPEPVTYEPVTTTTSKPKAHKAAAKREEND